MKFALKVFKINNNKVVRGANDKMFKNLSKFKKLKNKKSGNLMPILNIRVIKKDIFLTFNIRKVFNYLKQMFIQILIF